MSVLLKYVGLQIAPQLYDYTADIRDTSNPNHNNNNDSNTNKLNSGQERVLRVTDTCIIYRDCQDSSLVTDQTVKKYENNRQKELLKSKKLNDKSNKAVQLERVHEHSKNMMANQRYKKLFQMMKIRNKWFISENKNQAKQKQSENLWYVIRNKMRNNLQNKQQQQDQPCKQMQLKEGSVVKLGNAKLTVRKIKHNEQHGKQSNLENPLSLYQQIQLPSVPPQKNLITEQYYQDSSKASTIEEAPCCRYCYQKSVAGSNLMGILCGCEGTARYVHLDCLKQWVINRSQYKGIRFEGQQKMGSFQQNGFIGYVLQKSGIICQICKHQFDLQSILPCFEAFSQSDELGSQQKPKNQPFTSYLILQVQLPTSNQEKIAKTYYYIIDLLYNHVYNKKGDLRITVGRKLQSTVMIPELTVSREHCALVFKNNKKSRQILSSGKKEKNRQSGSFKELYIHDLNSKFGTLVKKKYLEIHQNWQSDEDGNNRMTIQIEKNKIQVEIEQPGLFMRSIKSLVNLIVPRDRNNEQQNDRNKIKKVSKQ